MPPTQKFEKPHMDYSPKTHVNGIPNRYTVPRPSGFYYSVALIASTVMLAFLAWRII